MPLIELIEFEKSNQLCNDVSVFPKKYIFNVLSEPGFLENNSLTLQ